MPAESAWERRIRSDDVLLFRYSAPTFNGHPFSVHGQPAPDGKTVRLRDRDHEGRLTMDATATLA